MTRLPAALAIAVVFSVVGCGGDSGLSSAEKEQASNEFAMAEASVTTHLADDSDLPPEVEELARQTLLESDADAYIALVRKWDDQGMDGKELRRYLSDAEGALRTCSPCVAAIRRERENY